MDSGWDMMDCVTSACREELEHFRMVGLSSFSLPYLLSFDLCRSLWVRRVFHLGAVGAFGGFLWLGHDGLWKRIRLQEISSMQEKLEHFQMRTPPPLLLLESLRELREFGRRTGLVGYLRRYLLSSRQLLSCRNMWALPVSSSPSLPTLSFCPFARLVSLGLCWDFFWLGHDGLRKRSQHHVFFLRIQKISHMAAWRGFESVERIRSNKGVKCTWG